MLNQHGLFKGIQMIKSLLSKKTKKIDFIGKEVYYVNIRTGIQKGTLERVIKKQCEINLIGLKNMKAVFTSIEMAEHRYVKDITKFFSDNRIPLTDTVTRLEEIKDRNPSAFI